MKNINRRESPRVEIKLRCHVTSPALWVRNEMQTENLSRNGLLMRWHCEEPQIASPRVGQLMTVEIELPTHHGFGQKCIHCQGTVVRVADLEDRVILVALNLTYMDFRSFNDRYGSVHAMEPMLNSWMA